MSFLNKMKPNKPTATLEGYFIAMLAKSKFGKTTFAIELAQEFYGNLDSTLILAPEIGYKALSGVYAIPITGFEFAEDDENEEEKGFIQVVDELIENKNDIPFKFIIIDTITALERYAIAHAIKVAQREDKPAKRYRDISDLPWGAGYTATAELIYNEIDRLKKAGFGVFIIGHEKQKKTKNKDGFEFDYTTFNVLSKTSDIIEREADMIIYGDMSVDKESKSKVKTTRTLKFRSDGNILCGSRFKNFPDEIDNDPKVFLDTFKEAILSLYKGDSKALDKAKKEQELEAKKRDEKPTTTKKEKVEDEEENSVGLEEDAEDEAPKDASQKKIEDFHNKIMEIAKALPKESKKVFGDKLKADYDDVDFRNLTDAKELRKVLKLAEKLKAEAE